ncbi:5-(carboxyamino)imidazole ribonucleotide synthase [bacterium AH-315-J23]|nr:5-(carboxyamino)imidazole ribonucleotide synthase [bacterium AH-315-J23]PHQ67958.1 MAG: 5-(carboxyamino)imidazole ribonucleotide synthase [Robiginitomaculum sp.]
MTKLAKDTTIGIFGGGQLGRMLVQAAHKLGSKTHVFDPFDNTPAGRIANKQTIAPFEDEGAVELFANCCDVLTYEFENIPIQAIEHASQFTTVYPDKKALQTSHDRLIEKTFLRDRADAPVVGFAAIETMNALSEFVREFGAPAILKTRRFGYDGKGQIKVGSPRDVKAGFARLGGTDLIVEAFAPFVREFSIIAARGIDGDIACYPLTENVHKDHRLHTSIAPAGDPQNVSNEAHAITHRILNALNYVGVMGIEFFELEGGQLIVNEIAPRVHNSGHWTQDAGCTDQFEQHIRAITGMKLGGITPKHAVKMTNLIGDEILQADALSAKPNTFVHNYDKRDIKEGRKMGHVNEVFGRL